MRLKQVKEAAINYFVGEQYYKFVIRDELLKHKLKKPIIILSYDIDNSEDVKNIPKLLLLLKKYRIKASFAVIGKMVEENPELFKTIVDEKHELINHSTSHPESGFDKLSDADLRKEIVDCHNIVYKYLKINMCGYRTPHFGHQHTSRVYKILKELGYKYSSSVPGYKISKINGITEYPVSLCNIHPYNIMDTSHAFRSHFSKHKPEEYNNDFKEFLDFHIKNKLWCNIYNDPCDITRFDYDEFLNLLSKNKKYIRSFGDIL